VSQPVKIQINSLEALERLIGGDSELEIEIRNSVVQKFAQKHLRGIADQYVQSTTEVVKAQVDNYLEKNLGTWQWGRGSTFVLNTKTKMALEDSCGEFLKETLQRVVNEKADSKDLDQLVQKYVDAKFNAKINDLVNRKVNDKIAKITEKLSQ
jgi:23S rRNA maturation mini-RNase III